MENELKRPREEEQGGGGGSPPRVRRPNMAKVLSRDYQIANGVMLSKSKVNGTTCQLTIIAAANAVSDVSKKKSYAYKRISLKGVVSHLDPHNTDKKLAVRLDTSNNDMEDNIKAHLHEIQKHHPGEKWVGLEDVELNIGSILEVSCFGQTVPDVSPGEVVVLSDLVATLSFVKAPTQKTDQNNDELGFLRPVNTPYINFKASFYKKGKLNDVEFKKAVSTLPLGPDFTNKNRFLAEDGQLQFPEEICYPNPHERDRTPIPMFTRLRSQELVDIWAALYNPRPSGFGVIRNRLRLYDEPPKEELEPKDGLPVFTTMIPVTAEKYDKEVLFEKGKIFYKCLRGPEPLNLIVAIQQPEDQDGLFQVGRPILCTAFSLYENRPDKEPDTPLYVHGIGILSPTAWEKYITQLMRGLEALIYIKINPEQSQELMLKNVHTTSNCTHAIRGTTSVIVNMHATLMGAGLRVPYGIAVRILMEAQGGSGKNGQPGQAGLLQDRYGIRDPYCDLVARGDKNSVKHFFVNAYTGSVENLPQEGDAEWDYFLIPPIKEIDEYNVTEGRTEVDILRNQNFWGRNNQEDWREGNSDLIKEWCGDKRVYKDLGVFCAKRES